MRRRGIGHLLLSSLTLTLILTPKQLSALDPAIAAPATLYIRGDVNSDGDVDIADAVGVLLYLFDGGRTPPCLRAADVNDDDRVQIGDAIFLLGHLFQGGPAPDAPYPSCGRDESEDGTALDCESFPRCEFESLAASYDLLTTIAGTGEERGGGVSGWRSEFEGAPATSVELSRPHHAIADAAGNIYVADKDAHAIRRVAPDGTLTTVAGTNLQGDGDDAPGPGTERELSIPNGLWVRADGTVYILDLGNSKIRRLSPGGVLTTMFSVPGGIGLGRGLWVSEDEQLAYVASGGEVKVWTPAGGVETYVDGFQGLGNLIVDPAGDLVVTDRSADRVYRIGADRELVTIAGGEANGGGDGAPALSTHLDGVRGVWFLPSGGYFLATHEGSQVWYVDTRGIIHLFLDGRDDHSHRGDGENFQTPGAKISEARAVSVDAAGNVIITESDYGYVRMVGRRAVETR